MPSRKKRAKKQVIWKESVAYLKESRNYVYAVTLVFFLSGVIGFAFYEQFGFFDDILRDLIDKTEGKGFLELMWFIFQNNTLSALIGMVAGVGFGIIPVMNAVTNGALGGYVYHLASLENGLGVIVYLVPHGVLELPAIFIALGIGVKFGMFIGAPRGKKMEEFKRRFWSSMKVFVTIILPLLAVASVIESALIVFG
jgi:stage II sporulation protein M